MQDVEESDLTELRNSFARCDTDGDGWITPKEFAALLQTLDEDLSDDECLLAFEMTDSDGNGQINFDEFLGWWTGD